MFKKSSIFFAIASSLLLAGCSLAPSTKQTSDDQAKQAEKLAKIMEKGGQAVCEISKVGSEEKYTITVKGKKMKMSGISMEKGKKGFMVNDTVYTYIWDEGSKQGFKTKLATEEVTPVKNQPTVSNDDYRPEKVATEYEDETKYKVNCKEGNVPESEFIPPSDVKFIDPSDMVKSIPTGMKDLPKDYLKNIPSIPAGYEPPSE